MARNSFGSVSSIKQGGFEFYSLSMPSNVLAETCFVINRHEDPELGFQRELNEQRAKEIADYIDHGLGVIPSSIVLSAQSVAELEYSSRAKTLSFEQRETSFLIIDGQHRVYSFRIAKNVLRVPVIIFNGLSKKDETRLFIDINSKQKGVSSELLLDIKRLADYESDTESFLRDVFDTFNNESTSVLYGRLSAASRKKGSLSRSAFNSALNPITRVFGQKKPFEVYEVFNAYLKAFKEAILIPHELEERMFTVNVFKAVSNFLPAVASRVKDRFGPIYTIDNFHDVLEGCKSKIRKANIEKPGGGYKLLLEHFEQALSSEFTL